MWIVLSVYEMMVEQQKQQQLMSEEIVRFEYNRRWNVEWQLLEISLMTMGVNFNEVDFVFLMNVDL